jgi:hypothetical protein
VTETEFVRLKTSTSSGAVHKSNGDGTPVCSASRGKKSQTQGGDAREWVEVDESVYPRGHWDRCGNCFGGEHDD